MDTFKSIREVLRICRAGGSFRSGWSLLASAGYLIRCCAGFSPCTLEASCRVTLSFSLFACSLSSYRSPKPHSTPSTFLSPPPVYDVSSTTPS